MLQAAAKSVFSSCFPQLHLRPLWGCPITRRSLGGATMHSSHPISLRLEQTTRYLRNDHAAAQLPFSLRETVGDATNPELAAWRNDLTGWLERMVAPPRELVLWLPHCGINEVDRLSKKITHIHGCIKHGIRTMKQRSNISVQSVSDSLRNRSATCFLQN